jgi:hypothetical protein
MKVKFKNLLMGYTGKADDSVIYFSPKLGRYIIRRAPKYVEGEHHRRFSRIQKAIFAIEPSAAFKQDMKDYLLLYNGLKAQRNHPIQSWNMLYSKMMWSMHHIYQVDLSSIKREDLPDLPCQSVAMAVEAGLLPKVKGYEEFQAEI